MYLVQFSQLSGRVLRNELAELRTPGPKPNTLSTHTKKNIFKNRKDPERLNYKQMKEMERLPLWLQRQYYLGGLEVEGEQDPAVQIIKSGNIETGTL